jgi:hypothetical protein
LNPKRENMKKIILFVLTLAFITTGYSQQRPSQRSFASVMNQVKQKQIARDKMVQQVKQTTPSNAGRIQLQANTTSTDQAATQQQPQAMPRTNQQQLMNKQANQQQVKIKKE